MVTKILGWIVVTVVFASACNKNGDLTAMRQVDRDFILKASEINLAEIELAEVAQTRTANPLVLAFAQLITIDHQPALDELKAIANSRNTAITTSINLEHQDIKQKLSEMSGYSFDTAYMQSQIHIHENGIALFESEIANGNDPDVRDYATAYLPDIQRHRHKADSISRHIEQ